MSETQSIALADPNRVGGGHRGVLSGVGANLDIAKVAAYDVRPGEDPNAWRFWGGAMCEIVEITGSTDGQAITGECWIYGYMVTATGTSSTLDLHQGTSTSGVNLLGATIATGTFNVVGYTKQIGFGPAVHCPNGIYANWGGTGSPKVALFVVRAQPT